MRNDARTQQGAYAPRSPGIAFAAILFFLFQPFPLCAQAADDGRVTVVDLSGTEKTGSLQQLSADTLMLAGETPRSFAVEDLLSLRFDGHAPAKSSDGPQVLLAGGDRLLLQTESLDEEHLSGSWKNFPAWPQAKIPLEQVRGVIFHLPENAETRRRLAAELLEFREKNDAVMFRNGDRLSGRLIGLTADTLMFEGPVGTLDIARDNIAALAFNSELLSAPDATGKRALLELSDGSRLSARRVAMAEQGLFDVETQFGAALRVPSSAIVSLRFLGGKAVYLSDLEPAEYAFTPYLSTRWPLRVDRNVLGGPLRLRGREFAKGLGVHSQSAVSYALGGKYKQFRVTAGIDDSADGKGSVRFAVEIDGERVFTSQLMTGADKPAPLGPFDVEGKQKLTLIVEFGQLGDILDHADWCDPVLIR